MAPEQLQTCMDACNLCAEACDHFASSMESIGDKEDAASNRVAEDCAAMCRLFALSLSHAGKASTIIGNACMQLCELCAEECAQGSSEAAAQCVRACRHCAQECRRMTEGLPHPTHIV